MVLLDISDSEYSLVRRQSSWSYLHDNLFVNLVETGVKAVDILFTIGRGQRELIYW